MGRPLQSVVVIAALALAAPVASQEREDPEAPLQLWWNDANVIAVLGLDAETRGAMDTAYRTYAVDGSAKAMRQRRTAFKSALQQGDWEQAKAELAGIAEPTIREGTLKIETLRLLSPEQHAILVERFPTVFRRKWKPASGWEDARPAADPAGP